MLISLKKDYFSKNIATNKYPAGQNQEFALVMQQSLSVDHGFERSKDSVADDLEWGYFNYPSVPDGKDDNTANNIANQVLAINKKILRCLTRHSNLSRISQQANSDKKMTKKLAMTIPTNQSNADAWPTELSGVKKHSMQQQHMTGRQA